MALNFALINTRNQSIGNRVRDAVAFGSRAVFWAKNPATVATILRHTVDGVTVLDTADVDTVNSDNPQRVPQMVVPGDGFLYFIADPGADAGLAVFRTSDLVSFAQYQNSLSLRATQYGGLGPIPLSFPPPEFTMFAARTEVLAAPVEDPATFFDNPPNWTQDAAIGGAGAVTAIVGGFDWRTISSEIESRAVARSAELRVFSVPGNYVLRHTALATIHRMVYWPLEAVVLYARFWQGAEPANTSRVYSTTDADDWTFTERWAGQITGIISDFELMGNDLLFATVDGQPTGANLRVYKATSLTAAPTLEATLVPANPALDSSAFLCYHDGMKKAFVTLQTLAGPARQEIYAASTVGGPSAAKRARMGLVSTRRVRRER